MRSLAVVVFLSFALWAALARAEDIAVPVEWQGKQIQLRGDFQKPVGAGPFPAVIDLHGCSGYGTGASLLWAAFLWGQGYATLSLDSFTARDHRSVCASHAVTPADRALERRRAW